METYTSIHNRVQQKIKDKEVDVMTSLVLATIADDGLEILNIIVDNNLDTLEVETARKLINLSLEFSNRVDIREFVESYLYDGAYSEHFAELRRLEELEDAYDNQF